MKKFLFIMCAITLLSVLGGCSLPRGESGISADRSGDTYITGVWISYSELDAMLAGGDFKNQFEEAIAVCKEHGITDVFVHTRAFCDSVYKSELFPLRESVKGYDFDVFDYMISQCHKSQIRFHAWLNPYRVRTADSNTDSLSPESPARKWLEDGDDSNDGNICLYDGIYLNPASSGSRTLIIDGAREIANNYDVDGIHFDDYFYPTQSEEFDASSYAQYCGGNQKPLSLEEWRRANVNALISGCYTAVKFINSNIIFSVSPSASIEENFCKHYADIKLWMECECVDYIIPQLYFGFEYPNSDFCFDNLLEKWQKATEKTDTKLLIGLASYKINTDSQPDSIEWANGTTVINRQIEMCQKSPDISGHVFFSYSSLREYL